MANVPYDQGVPFATPNPTPPHDYQEIQANPSEFGGEIARGGQELGAGVTTAVKFYSQIAAQQAVGNWQDQANQSLTQFKSLKGQDAMTARDGILDNLKEAEEEGAASLPNPDAQLAFTQNIRYLRARYEGEIGAHYDQQAQVWGVGVNETAASQHLQDIEAGTVRGDLGLVASGAAGLTDARLKQAQLLYGTMSPQMADAVRGKAAAEAIETQVKTLIPTDPARASRILQANSDKLPAAAYEELSQRTKAYADDMTLTGDVGGYMRGQPPPRASGGAGPAPSANTIPEPQRAALLQQAVVGTPIPPATLDALVKQESGWDAGQRGSAGEIGLAQIKPSTATAPGVGMAGVDPTTLNDPAANLRFGAQYLYARGKAAGLTDADWKDPAKVAVVLKEYNGGGDPDYVQHVTSRMAPGGVLPASYSGGAAPEIGATPVAAPGTSPPVASAGVVAHNPAGVDMLAQKYIGARDEAARLYPGNSVMQDRFVQRVHQDVNELMMLQNRDEAVREKARKDASEAAGQQVLTTLHKNPGQFDPALIWNQPDNVMTWEEKQHLAEVANYQLTQAGIDPVHHAAGYTKVLAGITADPSAPNYINSMRDIYSRAGEGGDLNRRDADELSQIFTRVHKDPDYATLKTREASMLKIANRALMFTDPEVPDKFQTPDRVGQDIFDGQFVQTYLPMVDRAAATGKPDELEKVLNKDFVLNLAHSMRSQADIDRARMEATGQSAPGDVEKPGTPLPPVPTIQDKDGKPVTINPGGWGTVMVRPPVAESGQPYTHAAWATYLSRLVQNPDPKTIQYFDQHFAAQGYSGADIVKALTTPAGGAALLPATDEFGGGGPAPAAGTPAAVAPATTHQPTGPYTLESIGGGGAYRGQFKVLDAAGHDTGFKGTHDEAQAELARLNAVRAGGWNLRLPDLGIHMHHTPGVMSGLPTDQTKP